MENLFYTKRGRLKRYAFACGYIEREGDDDLGVCLDQISGNVLRVSETGRNRQDCGWTGTSLTAARREMAKLRRHQKAR